MNTPARHIRKPRGDSILLSTAIFISALWVLAGLFPPFWMAITAFKSTYEGLLFPPTFLPSMPQRVTIIAAYDSTRFSAGPDALLAAVRDDAFTAEWATFDSNPREALGEVRFQAYVDGHVFYESGLRGWAFWWGRHRIWSTTILDREQILKHKAEIQDGETLQFYEKNYKVYAPGKGPALPSAAMPSNKIVAAVRDTLGTLGMTGDLRLITNTASPARLFDAFVTGWNSAKKSAGALKWGRYFINSAVITAGGIVTQWVFTAFAGFGLSRLLRRRASRIMTMFFIATMMIPPIATVIPLYLQMQKWGLINTYWAIILPAIPSGFIVYLFKGFFDALPGDLFEAARMDGATEFWVFARVVVPLSTAVFSVVTLMCFLGGWNGGGGLMWSSLVVGREDMWPFPLALFYLTRPSTNGSAGMGAQQNQFMSMTLLASIPTLILFIFFQDRVAKGLVWSGLKQ